MPMPSEPVPQRNTSLSSAHGPTAVVSGISLTMGPMLILASMDQSRLLFLAMAFATSGLVPDS